MGIGCFEPYWLDEGRLYCETLPKGREPALPHEQRIMQFLWEALDRAPLGLMINFAVPVITSYSIHYTKLYDWTRSSTVSLPMSMSSRVAHHVSRFHELADRRFVIS